jgi:hypothetical protein
MELRDDIGDGVTDAWNFKESTFRDLPGEGLALKRWLLEFDRQR